MKYYLAAMFCCVAGWAYTQNNTNAKKFAETITATDLRRHLFVVAGPDMEGRETATPGERRAAEYIQSRFSALGCKPGYKGSYLMPFPLYKDSIEKIALVINGEEQELFKSFAPLEIHNGSSYHFSEVVVLKGSVADSSRKPDITGRLIMTDNRNAAIYALKNGAGAILFVHDDFGKDGRSGKGALYRQLFKPRVSPNVLVVNGKIATSIAGDDYISERQDRSKITAQVVKADVSIDIRKHADTLFSNNVLGMIEGTDKKDEYLFITAHYDHEGKRGDSVIYYGADDDGSGTVTILELAEAFAKAKAEGKGPRRTIVFMTVSGEEKGLWGSDYYSSHPVFPLEKTTADLNIDMIGRTDPEYKGDTANYIYTIGENKLSSELKGITDSVNKKYTRLQIDRKFNDPNDPNRFYYRSDHYNFAKKGVPIIFYFNGTHADYHQPTDTPDKINYHLMEKRARLIFYTAWEIANRNEMLKRDLPL